MLLLQRSLELEGLLKTHPSYTVVRLSKRDPRRYQVVAETLDGAVTAFLTESSHIQFSNDGQLRLRLRLATVAELLTLLSISANHMLTVDQLVVPEPDATTPCTNADIRQAVKHVLDLTAVRSLVPGTSATIKQAIEKACTAMYARNRKSNDYTPTSLLPQSVNAMRNAQGDYFAFDCIEV